ncbi:YbaB/EbfC family nucleoid-associated protein [Nonomuraea sp. NPDC000554]|uniref:YbaB/EbfC family nucleoid-associated protein n=1 Tax=Nonomuraea sp. NPDC000554 TaxID=3154259 RepID=UPI00331D0120
MNGFDEFRPEDLERITAQAEDMLARIEGIRGEVGGLVGRGESADGQVRVSSDANGRLTGIELAPRAMRLDSQKLAEELLKAAQQAQDDADGKVRTVMAETLGEPLADPAAVEERFGRVLESFESSLDVQLQAIEELRRNPA